ncbi:inner centromere protein [Nomia melanderi]|uniref:inner centromere protein n=1 Tax=Nomia melanderi TaxID=2448451 RepID=UPI0013041D64|nr:calponin homology domain-containing protein DDB_G0272472-like [Nomia melanderi]
MGTRSKDKIKAVIAKDILDIYNRCTEVKKIINDNVEATMDYLHDLLDQIPQSASGPLITKTPKVLRKKGVKRIETIPEDEVIVVDNPVSESIIENSKVEVTDNAEESVSETTTGRSRRAASKKAANSIKKQQSMSLSKKLRRPSSLDKKKNESRAKRKQSARSSSDEESTQGPTKHSKVEESILRQRSTQNSEEETRENDQTITEENMVKQEKLETSRKSSSTWHSNKKISLPSNDKTHDIINDTVIAPKSDGMEEASMYEDAIEKPTPIMNSTMNLNSTHVIYKMMNATVVLEPLSAIKLNETVTISKNKMNSTHKESQEGKNQDQPEFKSPKIPKQQSPSSIALQDRMKHLKEAMANKEFDELITEDESSPEVKKHRPNIKKQDIKKRQKRTMRSMSSSEDEILSTPAKPALKDITTGMSLQEIRNTYKSNALFSPYAKESVKRRVEAFEQVGMHSPKPPVDVDAPTRVTRTKTRAIAAAQADGSDVPKVAEKTVAQKLARKSLAKAKKISLAKHAKHTEDSKENKAPSAQKISRLLVADKGSHLQQQKTTPLTKTKIQLPMSVSRIPQTPANNPIIHNNKALTGTRSNIITSVESFIQSGKPVSKRNSLDKTEEKKRKLNDEDARKKRDEALRLQTEEKRRKRQEKELKNKLKREANEKLEAERRQKTEKEREEKARIQQQMLEKQREELERKRLAQLQRAQEKEERRKLEEQQRLQRLQEQEEAERQLAEQRRREQEAEKRKELEARAQQQANAEAMRIKHQMLNAQAKYGNKHQGPTNYILDSEPDEDESDDESRPKHAIPYWAQPHVRKTHLAIQRYIPAKAILRFFDSKKCTPDLTELFQGIDRSRLKRTSSAIWKTPPRYSMMEAE